MRRRRWPWLVVAALLFLAAALVTSLASTPKPPPPRVTLPRWMDDQASARLKKRKTLPKLVVTGGDETQPPAEERRLFDPVIAAMPASVKKAAVVVEANALRHSPVGQLFIDCFVGSERAQLDQLKQMGIDPLKDIDRISAFDGTFVVTGSFGEAKWAEVMKNQRPTALNAHTTLWEGEGKGQVTATWKNQMVIVGPDRAAVTAVVDRLEGRAPVEKPVLDERDSYGEIYGVVSPAALAEVLARDQPALAERLRTVVERITVHVDASHDVGIVADARGAGQDAADFGKTVGGALSLGRLAAQAQGNQDLAAILEYARVAPGGDGAGFRTELALPLAFFEQKLRDCPGRKRTGGN